MDNVKEWTFLPIPELLTMASCRNNWKRISAEASLCPPDDATGQLNWKIYYIKPEFNQPRSYQVNATSIFDLSVIAGTLKVSQGH